MIWVSALGLSSPMFIFNSIPSTQSVTFDSNFLTTNDTTPLNDNNNNDKDKQMLLTTTTTTTTTTTSTSTSIINDFNETSTQTINDDFSIPIGFFDTKYCVEKWSTRSRLIYSLVCIIIQYIIPILIAVIAYGSIWWKLKKQQKRLNTHTNRSYTKNKPETLNNTNNNSNINVVNINNTTTKQVAVESTQQQESRRRRRNMKILLVTLLIKK
jgi:hypothetical protein